MRAFALLALAGVLSACQQSTPVSIEAAQTVSAAPQVVAPKVSGRFVDFEDAQKNALWDKATAQLAARKLATPVGDNAVETYLTLKAAVTNGTPEQREAVQAALNDMLPYVLIQTDNALAQNNIPDAMRLTRMINSIDPTAPSLPRLVATIKERSATPTAAPIPAVQ